MYYVHYVESASSLLPVPVYDHIKYVYLYISNLCAGYGMYIPVEN